MPKLENIEIATDGTLGSVNVLRGEDYNLFGVDVKNLVMSIQEVGNDPSSPSTNTFFESANLSHVVTHPHPVNYVALKGLKDVSTHHSACIKVKQYATVGLGFFDRLELEQVDASKSTSDIKKDVDKVKQDATTADLISMLTGNMVPQSRVSKSLDPLTFFGFQNELLDAVEDFMDGGTGYLEVARDSNDVITGINHIMVEDLHPMTMGTHLFYQYDGMGVTKHFALFGHKDWFMENVTTETDRSKVSEIIPFIEPSNRVKFYGYPSWLAAAVDIDLTASSKQYKADFYNNRGILDFIIAVTGAGLSTAQEDSLNSLCKSSSGNGRRWGSATVNLSNKDASIEVIKLAAENATEEQFKVDNEVLSQNIVSAHRVPTLLANILIPGKLGASNEFINALIGFQLLNAGPYQQIIQNQLMRTLGNKELNGGLDLDADDFRLRTITSQINITGLDAISRSRSEATSAENSDRDFEKGVKK